MRRCITMLAALLIVQPLSAAQPQEALEDILARGYVRRWLVCGPFPPDQPGGILAAVKAEKLPLGRRDYMAAVGGMPNVKPRDGLEVSIEGSDAASWQDRFAEGPSLDLANLFPGRREGIAYAAFYAEGAAWREVYFDLQSSLGVRVYLNGLPAAAMHTAPITAGGVDRFVVGLREGANLVVIEMPGATYATLAEAAGMDETAYRRGCFANRPLLKGLSGFEMALRLLPVQEFAGVYYVPRLYSRGAVSTFGDQTAQAATLTLFNGAETPSPPLFVQARVEDGPASQRQIIDAIAPHAQREALIAVPLAETPEAPFQVEVTLEHENEAVQFLSTIEAQAGSIYVITGQRYDPGRPEDQATRSERRLAEFKRNLALLAKDPQYGFDLGGAAHWQQCLLAYPQARQEIADALALLRCGGHAACYVLDERLVPGELLVRNLALAAVARGSILGGFGGCYTAWRTPGIAPQTPQLLTQADLGGLISTVPIAGLPALFEHVAPDGSSVLHRRKQPSLGPKSIADLYAIVARQRQELAAEGFDVDVYVNESLVPPPESFFLGACTALERTTPRIHVTGAGGREFIAAAGRIIEREQAYVLPSTCAMLTAHPGSIIAQPEVKQAHCRAANLTMRAERWATFAALTGASYPSAVMDHAWRQLLWTAAPERLGYLDTPRNCVDALAALREAAAAAQAVHDNALAYIAQRLDTLTGGPDDVDNAAALVVFNPSSWPRHDVAFAELDFTDDPAVGVSVEDAEGRAVPFWLDRAGAPTGRVRKARLEFLAENVPPLGYKCYYLRTAGAVSRAPSREGAQIENEYFRILVDPVTGAVASLYVKDMAEEFAETPLNEVLLLDENPARNNRGRELWTTGGVTRCGEPALRVEVQDAGWRKRIIAASPLAGGHVTRTLTIYQGLPRIDCTLRVEGLELGDRILALAFPAGGPGHAPVYGERFGAIVGRRSRQTRDLRTQGRANPSGAATYPAWCWAAFGPGDGIEAGRERRTAFGPCTIVYGNAAILRRAAREVLEALAVRGIPAVVMPAVADQPGIEWRDATAYAEPNADLEHGAGFHILIGSAAQNAYAQRVCADLPAAETARFNERQSRGAALYLLDRHAPDGAEPVPTLILAGLTLTQTTDMARRFAQEVSTTGVFSIPPEAYLPEAAAPVSEAGLALCFEGTGLCCAGPNGGLLWLLAHGSGWAADEDGLDLPPVSSSLMIRYALYPYAGRWRRAGVARAAHGFAEPLRAVVEPLHLGGLPGEQSFFDPGNLSFVAPCVKPAGYAEAARTGRPDYPGNGFVVRGYESVGMPWQGAMRCFASVREVAEADIFDTSKNAFPLAKRSAQVSIEPGVVHSLRVTPGVLGQKGPAAELGPAQWPDGPVFSRYWRHNVGAVPMGGRDLSVMFDGTLGEQDATIQVAVANPSTRRAAAGTLYLAASGGWSVAPTQFTYDVAPGGVARFEAAALRNMGSPATGGIVARTAYNGRTYRDVLDLAPEPVRMACRRGRREVVVTVTNRGDLPAEGHIEVVGPPSGWPELGGALFDLVARRLTVAVPPFEEQEYIFIVDGPGEPDWLVAKLAVNGRVFYQRAPERKPWAADGTQAETGADQSAPAAPQP